MKTCMHLIAALLAAGTGLHPASSAAGCAKNSPAHAVGLVELYTSEGCDSCPQADRWLSRIARDGPGPDRLVPLALHVDYWDRLGWKDRFASPRFTERQRALAQHSGSRAVYTPGVFLNLEEFRGWGSARFDDALRSINARPARADIRLELDSPSASQLALSAEFRLKPGAQAPAQAYVALYENRLATDVKAGENRGVTLRHDYVVREWFGPIGVQGSGAFRKTLALEREWKTKDLGVAAFVQDGGGVLQATALAVCAGG